MPRKVPIGTRVRQLRERRGLTQAELAERAGIHRVSLAKIEAARQHKTPPTLKLATLEQLARALRVSVVKLLG